MANSLEDKPWWDYLEHDLQVKNALDFEEAQEKVSMIIYALDKAFKECKTPHQESI
ncbi:MAG: hypothetical protein ACC618_00330 [Patescibacteria group bacterium]